MSNDILYDCAKAFKKITDYEYEILLLVDKTIKDIKLTFSPSEFMHLAALEKLKDKPIFQEMTSKDVFEAILKHSITYNNISDSKFIKSPINDVSKNNIEYYVTDRIIELTNLYNNLHSMTNENVSIYKWIKDVSPDLRPNHSDINADILFEFKNSVSNKFVDETVCTFFVETSEKPKAVGMSIFPTDISYSDDGKIRLPEYKILLVDEICKSTGIVTHLIKCSPEELQKAKEAALRKDQSITIANDLKALKSRRRAIIEDPENQSAAAAYKKKLAIFKNINIYTDDMLKAAVERLASQMNDSHNAAAAAYIQNEIKYINNELEQRKGQTVSNSHLKSFAIAFDQINTDGTLSKKTVAEVAIPKTVNDIQSKAERDVHTIMGSISSLFFDVAEKLKSKLFTKTNKKADIQENHEKEEKDTPEADENPDPEDEINSTDSTVSKELSDLFKAREDFSLGNISLNDYGEALRQYLLTLHGEEMWREAAELFERQLAECPEDKRKYIARELNVINENIKRKFPLPVPKFDSMSEIKEFAKQARQKLQSEKNISEEEKIKSKDDEYIR